MKPTAGSSYDFIIVGAGSAGCVLANRLSADPAIRVLLVEAGKSIKNPFIDMPLAVPFFFHRPDTNWNYTSEVGGGIAGRALPLPRGRLLGGCSAMNGMTFARGHRLDYNDWAEQGATGWSFDEVLPYFRKLETSWSDDGTFHGNAGPLSVEQARGDRLLYEQVRDAAVAAGIPATNDYHVTQADGVARPELTTLNGRRSSVRSAYLKPVIRRHNLTVLTGAVVRRVVLEGRRAVGIAIEVDGAHVTLATAREVILSAGTYNSPKLLLLSGIGPAAQIAAHGIDVVSDLPGVGANLIEHPSLLMSFSTGAGSFTDELRIDRAILSTARWLLTGGGAFASNGCNANIFFKTDDAEDRPDIQLMCTALSLGAALWHPFSKPPQHELGALVTLLRQDSRGTVELRSGDPAAAPKIDLKLLTAPADVQRLIRAVRRTREIYAQSPLRERGTTETLPGGAIETDAALETFIRANINIAHHPVGTCKMGKDAASVVNPDLTVHGFAGLRIVDASVMPGIPGGNTNVPVIMIAEKAADLILAGARSADTMQSRSKAAGL